MTFLDSPRLMLGNFAPRRRAGSPPKVTNTSTSTAVPAPTFVSRAGFASKSTVQPTERESMLHLTTSTASAAVAATAAIHAAKVPESMTTECAA